MENPTPPVAPATQEKKDNKRPLIIIIILLIATNAILAWLYVQEHNRKNEVIVLKETIEKERDNVKTDLLKLQEEYNTLQTNDQKIQAELEEKKAQIAQLLEEADKHKDDAYIISKLKRETETLRKIMKSYVHTIDSLNTLNQTLTAEKAQVQTELVNEQGKSAKLNQEKEELKNVVATGQLLKAQGIKAVGVRLKSGGKKEVETDKAKRAEKIKVSFTLSENRIAQKGSKDVYLRVITPDGKELARGYDDANAFTFNGVRGYFCEKESVNYDNKEVPMSIYAGLANGFLPGRYILEVYCDQAMIGQTTLTLE